MPNPGKIGMLTFSPHQSALHSAACRGDATFPIANFGRLEALKLPFSAQLAPATVGSVTLGRVHSAAITVAPPLYGSIEVTSQGLPPATPGRIEQKTQQSPTNTTTASASNASPSNLVTDLSPSHISRSSRSPHPRSPEEPSGVSINIPQQTSPPTPAHDAQAQFLAGYPTMADSNPNVIDAVSGQYGTVTTRQPEVGVGSRAPLETLSASHAYPTPSTPALVSQASNGSSVFTRAFAESPSGNGAFPWAACTSEVQLGVVVSSPEESSTTMKSLRLESGWSSEMGRSARSSPPASMASSIRGSPAPETRSLKVDLPNAEDHSLGTEDEKHQEDAEIQLELAASSEWEWLSIPAQERRHDELGLRPPKVAEFIASSDFVGLGCFCATSRALQCMGLKNFSYPFDWVRSSTSGIIHCLDTRFEDFLTWSITGNDGPKGNWFGGSQWGGSFWHHDPSSAKARQEFVHRIERLYGLREIAMSTTRIFVRAVNNTREILESFRLFEALQRALPAAEIYLLILVDLQSTSGLIGLSGAPRVLVYRVDAGVYADGGRDWTMRKQSEAYAIGCALAIRAWSGELDCSTIPQMAHFEAIYRVCDGFDGGNPATSLYWPRQMLGELITIHWPSVQERLNRIDPHPPQGSRQSIAQNHIPASHSWGAVIGQSAMPPSPYPSYASMSGMAAPNSQQALRTAYRLQPAPSPSPARFCMGVFSGPPQQGFAPPQGMTHKMSLTSLAGLPPGLQMTPRTPPSCAEAPARASSPKRMSSAGRHSAGSAAQRTRSPRAQSESQYPAVVRCASPFVARFGNS